MIGPGTDRPTSISWQKGMCNKVLLFVSVSKNDNGTLLNIGRATN